MLHEIVTGGYEFLPFARSCITKLKKLGMAYANQSFEVDGVSIKVRIEPGHEYIRIDGGIAVLSGVSKGGEIVEVASTTGSGAPTNWLHEFKPTPDCLNKVMGSKGVGSFQDVKSLATEAAQALAPEYMEASQLATVTPSMYSGRMQKAIQYILGRSDQSDKNPLMYNYQWGQTHLISKGDKGGDYLVEISKDRGVLAMRLPVTAGRKCEAVTEATKEFKGVPSGKTFPTDDVKLEKAVLSGKVARLLPPEGLSKFYLNSGPASYDHGWTTNTAGSEAHAVMFTSGPEAQEHASHYKLSLNLIERPDDAPEDNPCVTGDVVLTLVSTGNLYSGGGEDFYQIPNVSFLVLFYEHRSNRYKGLSTEFIEGATNNKPGRLISCDVTVFVYFSDDVLKKANYKWVNHLGLTKKTVVSGSPPTRVVGGQVWAPWPKDPITGQIDKSGPRPTMYDPYFEYYVPGTYPQTSSYFELTTPVGYISEKEGFDEYLKQGAHSAYESTVVLTPKHDVYDKNGEYFLVSYPWAGFTTEVHSVVRRTTRSVNLAVTPKGMRNGWMDISYQEGRKFTSDISGGYDWFSEDWLFQDYWLYDHFSRTYPDQEVEGVTIRNIHADNYPDVDDHMDQHAVYEVYRKGIIEVVWHPDEKSIKENDKNELELFTKFVSGQIDSLPDGNPIVFMWSADSANANSVRSKVVSKILTDGPLVADQTEVTTYSFTGYTGPTEG